MTLQLNQDVLKRRVFNQGVYDNHSKNFMLGQTLPYIKKDGIVLDIGAAVGMYSTFWAPHCKKLYAFEAVEPVFNQLQKLEDKFDNVEVFNTAVSDFDGESEFYVDDKRLSNSSFRDLVDGIKTTVNTVKIDSLLLTNVCFMKIDVEGHELDVLNGARGLITNCKPTVMCEIYPKFNNGPIEDTFKFFFDRGYKCFYNVKKHGLFEISSIEEAVQIASDNVFIQKHDGDFLFTHDD